jgi:hypothetical protein
MSTEESPVVSEIEHAPKADAVVATDEVPVTVVEQTDPVAPAPAPVVTEEKPENNEQASADQGKLEECLENHSQRMVLRADHLSNLSLLNLTEFFHRRIFHHHEHCCNNGFIYSFRNSVRKRVPLTLQCEATRMFSLFRDEEANASFLLGKRDVILNNYQSACDHLSKTCERM